MQEYFSRFKDFFDSRTLRTIAVSALTVVIILAITFGAVWYNRGHIFQYFASGYARSVAGEQVQKDPATGLPSVALSEIPVFSTESLIEGAVDRANPAVVAITVSKNVPKFKTSYGQPSDPFQQFFGG